MEFVSAQQTAERLGVTVRAVQKWAKEGRLPGARQMGRSWLIPADVTGPAEPAEKPKPPVSHHIPMPLLNASFEPGNALAYIESISDETDRTVAMAEYDYFSGNAERAAKAVELLLAHPDFNVAVSACNLYFLANRALGKAHLAFLCAGTFPRTDGRSASAKPGPADGRHRFLSADVRLRFAPYAD